MITGLTTERAIGRMSMKLKGVPTSTLMVSFSCYRVDDGPLVHEKVSVSRSRAETEEPWLLDRKTINERVPNQQIVRVFADLVDDRWVWTDIVGVVEDDVLQSHLESLLFASPPVHPSDVVTLVDGTTLVVPDATRVEPFDMPGVGAVLPTYRVDTQGRFAFADFRSNTFDLAAFDGFEVELQLYNKPSPQEEPLISRAFENLIAAGPALRDGTTPYVLQYYRDVRAMFGDEDCEEYGIPLTLTEDEVWDHVTLSSQILIRVNLGNASPYFHPDSAYVLFEGSCTWEEEHGILLSYLNGNRIARVASFDGHETKASAHANADLLDEVY